MRLEISERTLRLAAPLQTSYGEIRERDSPLVALSDKDGAEGFGEAALLPSYDGVSLERVRDALERYRLVLAGAAAHGGGDPADPRAVIAELLDSCRAVADLPAALAAVDLALWDLAGRRAGRPVAGLLCERPAAGVAVNATVTSVDRAGAAEQAASAAREGFGAVKLKVGIGDDAGRVAAVRAAVGPLVALRLDANGAWSVQEAVAAIESLSPAGLELVEEPTHGLENVRRAERVGARVAIDETAAEPGALSAGAADAVCLKVSRCGASARDEGGRAGTPLRRGGVRRLEPRRPARGRRARSTQPPRWRRAALPHCGLATLRLFEDLPDPLPVLGGEIALRPLRARGRARAG